jgi:hypothetical protein
MSIIDFQARMKALKASLANARPAEPEQSAVDPAEIAWRVEAMRAQVPPHGPILTLCVRPDVPIPTPAGMCGSCGQPREASQTYVCRACQAAKALVLEGTS